MPELSSETFRLLLSIGLAPVAIAAVVAPELFSLLFGVDWRESGVYLQFIAPWIAAVFVFAPLTTLYAVLEKQRMEFVFQMTLFVVRVSALIMGAVLGGPTLAISFFAASATLIYLGFGLNLLRLAGSSVSKLAKILVAELLFAFFLAALLSVVASAIKSELLVVLVATIFGLVALLRIKPALSRLSQLGQSQQHDG